MELKAEELNTTDTFAQHSKMKRKINKARGELKHLEEDGKKESPEKPDKGSVES